MSTVPGGVGLAEAAGRDRGVDLCLAVEGAAIGPDTIQIAIATIMTFSVSETKPSGTLLLPPTQAHFSSRLST